MIKKNLNLLMYFNYNFNHYIKKNNKHIMILLYIKILMVILMLIITNIMS